ncbi:MAG: zf-HC2 domain-containing protein [Thermodesulfobacteriota bacterium]
MKWRCGLIQRWLPEYLDGELRPFWHRRVETHLKVCAHCCQELEEIREAVAVFRGSPTPDPGPAFWQEFDRELHFKLAQVNQAPAPRRFKLPYYLVGALSAPALAVLILLAAHYLEQPHRPVLTQLAAPEQLVYAGRDDGLWQEEEFPSWDVNAVLVDLPSQERKILWEKVKY